MDNKILMSVLGIAVGIILIGSLLAPTVSDAMEDQYSTYSNGNLFMEKSTESHEIIMTSTQVTIDDIPTTARFAFYMMSPFISIVEVDQIQLLTSIGLVPITEESTLIYSDGVLTLSGQLEVSYPTPYIWVPSETPTDYVITTVGEGPYVRSLSDIVTAEYSYDAYTYVENGIITRTPSTVHGVFGGTLNEVSGVDELYKVVSITQTLVEFPDATAELHDAIIVPAKIRILVGDSSVPSILYAIPAMMLVALLVTAVGMIKRNE